MKKGLNFTPEEELEFKEMTKIHPNKFAERISVILDRIMNSIWMFFILIVYSLMGLVFPNLLTPLLFWSNAYQLSCLPIVAIAATVGTRLLLRLVFRVYLTLRELYKEQHQEHMKELAEQRKMHAAQKKEIAQLKILVQTFIDKDQKGNQ